MGRLAPNEGIHIPAVFPESPGSFIQGVPYVSPQDALIHGLPTEDQDRSAGAAMVLHSEVERGNDERELDTYHKFRRITKNLIEGEQ